MPAERLSALDASFLDVESPSAPMHVGWVATFDQPEHGARPGFGELFEHIAARLGPAARYRQRLAAVPLGVHEPVWVDDAGFDPAAHLLRADGEELREIVDSILSSPLPRDRPLWEMWIADRLGDGRVALVGKMHHCMVDGAAVAQLGRLLLDADPDAWKRGQDAGAWSPSPPPSAAERLTSAVAERAADGAALAMAPLRLAASPRRLVALPGAATRGARTLAHVLLPPAPGSPLNRSGSAQRHHVRVTRSVDELRAIRRRFRVAPNDVVLAACAGALRRFAERRGEIPARLKAMVPADVRSSADAAGSGNRIAFLFVELPCDEPDPIARLRAVHRATAQRQRDGEAEDVDAGFRALQRAPRPLRRALAHAFAHPRMFNLTISSMAGPAVPRHLRGCRLREVHSAVPLAPRHALSIGVVTAARSACFGLYADARTLPDADLLGTDLGHAMDELLSSSGGR
ncbi:MAG TPA: wax ester/triacylglycerol synthase family O-acyltransferase [Solirubrobacteraceae bacterium]|nr:wax ester/triacylglycerol synthase family O-acyltransferase [Solirubrobacteraceae bacterium]